MSKRDQLVIDDHRPTAVADALEKPKGSVDLNQDKIAELAYRHWVERGCPQGSADQDWFQAEKELTSAGNS